MIRILVTGGNGQLGSELKAIAPAYPHFDLTFTDLPELDLTDESALHDYFEHHGFDVVINCAAYTAVDKAESDLEKAFKVNRDVVKSLVNICNHYDCYLIQISTDYVFDGQARKPYKVDDIPNPRSVYGRSKLAGEEAMMECLNPGLIIRTSWLYSSFGKNFVRTILDRSRENKELRVVADQFGCPTYARDLAEVILSILPQAISDHDLHILHYSNEGICSWHDLASAITEIAGTDCRIVPITTAEYPVAAPRPAFSALDNSLVKEKFGIQIPSWKTSLNQCIELMLRA
jgi:dTDP-4-dehydrorhamnose reductase